MPDPQPGALSDPRTKKVLIVDDDEGCLNLLEILVKRDGFQIELARDGDEALEKLKRPFDALILDLMLPGTTGFGVIEQLAARSSGVPPVIVVTAFGSAKELSGVRARPFVALVLDKPLNQKLLLSRLHEVLGTQPKPW
ncbi:MAG: response regulator transcription factor [Elusimicrobia bacterium]|nr:response regulator transcription factor [Elusimicrobiota bacterium]MDE2237065.1 response regulator transcription factor [Elusimicrobiota bacterium]MDE2426861.1 response regulator transcription factor [Elusimicrobiota bacterium]